jgi:DNA-directed RNA polymerase subunit RPC12/RpoP
MVFIKKIIENNMNNIFCKNCGNKIDVDTKFCVKCGKSVEIITPSQTINDKKTRDSKISIEKYNNLALICFVLTILGIIGGVTNMFPFMGGLLILIGAILGKIALGQIKLSGERGRSLSMFSFVIGILVLVFIIISMILLYFPIGI